ncbi:hypothetical protein LZQ00_03165 [Sphingobacterium sp. SRCM116780]|uniref:hypothetical protein n=1 Tax=Sphingobacterium sp. SRCM116780 TaxID=2907623 RepID=UPI001F2EE2F2|nr:hypothetical protein [Sphingobacterium sp. SRCM116780]UIR56825.1 hypothetical protein LZQ00_03165 [Sphingobacterium sp. SRCM116780]
MKKLLLFICVSFNYLIAFGQLEANNFIVTPEGRVNWQKVYENKDVTFDDLVNTVQSNVKFSDIQIKENKITFLGTDIKTNPSEVGFSRMTTSFYALGEIKAFFTIDYKEGRYRITAVNISSNVPVVSLSRINTQGLDYEQTPIEESVGNGNGLKKGFIKKESLIMSHAIESQFKIVKQTDDNW